MSAPGLSFHSFGIHGGIHRIRAQRRAGEMLAVTAKQTGGDAAKVRCLPGTEVPATQAEMGITKKQSSTWRALASTNAEHIDAAC